MKYHDLREFLTLLEQQGELKRISLPVDPHLEITEIADRTLRAGGPALLFENPKGYAMPVLCNLFGTPRRVALGMGQEDVSSLREVGKLLAFLKEPEPPKGFRDLFDNGIRQLAFISFQAGGKRFPHSQCCCLLLFCSAVRRRIIIQNLRRISDNSIQLIFHYLRFVFSYCYRRFRGKYLFFSISSNAGM